MRDIDAAAAAKLIRGQLARVAPGVQPAVFMVETEQQSGLLLQRESGVYAFAHLTFQEYLAAVRLRERNMLSTLTANTDDQWWREVTLLYCANADAGPIVEACMEADTARSLLLASDCTEVARELDPDMRIRLDRVLSAEVNSNDPARAQLIGQVILARKLRRVRHEGDDVVVVNRPITHSEFALFRRSGSGRSWGPEHWTVDLTKYAPNDPVNDVSNEDVRAFCAWLTSADGWTYRRYSNAKELSGITVRPSVSVCSPNRQAILVAALKKAIEVNNFIQPKQLYITRTTPVGCPEETPMFRFSVAEREVCYLLSGKLRAATTDSMADYIQGVTADLRLVQLLSGCFKEPSDGVSGMAGGWCLMVSVWPVSACIHLT